LKACIIDAGFFCLGALLNYLYLIMDHVGAQNADLIQVQLFYLLLKLQYV